MTLPSPKSGPHSAGQFRTGASVALHAVAYGVLVGLALAADWLLHRFEMAAIGRHFGWAGSVVLVASFAYSLRKRRFLTHGSAKMYLASHELLGWCGALLVLIHAGVHFHALIPWLALAMMLVVVASGFIGKVLLRKATVQLERAFAVPGSRASGHDAQAPFVFLDGLVVDAMKRWRSVHMPLTAVFLALALVHVASILLLR